jgi:hypothetical protein
MLCTLSSCHAQCSSLCVPMRSPSAHRYQTSCLPTTTHSSSVQHRRVLDSCTDHHRGHAIAVVGSCAVIVVRLCDRHTGSEQGSGAEWCCRCKCVCCASVRVLVRETRYVWPAQQCDQVLALKQLSPQCHGNSPPGPPAPSHSASVRSKRRQTLVGGGACQRGHETQWATCVTVNQSYCTTSMFVEKRTRSGSGGRTLGLCHVSYSPSPPVLLDIDCAPADTGAR